MMKSYSRSKIYNKEEFGVHLKCNKNSWKCIEKMYFQFSFLNLLCLIHSFYFLLLPLSSDIYLDYFVPKCENFMLRIVDLLFNCSFRMCNCLELIFIYLENKYCYVTEETVMDQTSEKYRYHSAEVFKVVSSCIHNQTLENNT